MCGSDSGALLTLQGQSPAVPGHEKHRFRGTQETKPPGCLVRKANGFSRCVGLRDGVWGLVNSSFLSFVVGALEDVGGVSVFLWFETFRPTPPGSA